MESEHKTSASVTYAGFLDMQVCVPEGWSDTDVIAFANTENPCGTDGGWHIRRQGDKALKGEDERVACDVRCGFVHLMLDA